MIRMKPTEDEWKVKLNPEQFQVLRQCGTEPPFTGKYINHKENGVYVCVGCGNELFSSDTKFDSGSGWPNYWDNMSHDSVELKVDASQGMKRTEVLCKKCDGHLGHVFEDGSAPSGKRYCINSTALDFVEKE